jgi:hypothetical protein
MWPKPGRPDEPIGAIDTIVTIDMAAGILVCPDRATRTAGGYPRRAREWHDTISILVKKGIITIIIKLITTGICGMGRDSPLYALIGVVDPGQYRCWEA